MAIIHALEIETIKTGIGLAGSPIATIFAPKNSPPGSMESLVRFFHEHNIKAFPGYHGPNKNHVLRISGFKNDTDLKHLLQTEFPAWQEKQKLNGTSENMPILFPASLHFEPIDEVDHFPHLSPLRRYIKENANMLTSLAYAAGNVALLISGMRNKTQNVPEIDHFKVASSLSYMMASAVLVAFAYKADHPHDIYSVMKQHYPELEDPKDPTLETETKNLIQKTFYFLRAHPWETSCLLHMTGAASYGISAYQKNKKLDVIAATAAFIASSFPALIPEKGGRALVDFSPLFTKKDGSTLVDSLELFKHKHPSLSPVVNAAETFGGWVHESPLRAVTPILFLSNAGYGISAILQKPIDWNMVGVSGLYVSGATLQSQATKGRGPSFDEVCHSAATMIDQDPSLKDVDKQTLKKRIIRLADRLSDQTEIVHTKETMTKGIMQRSDRYQSRKETVDTNAAERFLQSEKNILKQSPFVSTHMMPHLFANNSKSQSTQV